MSEAITTPTRDELRELANATANNPSISEAEREVIRRTIAAAETTLEPDAAGTLTFTTREDAEKAVTGTCPSCGELADYDSTEHGDGNSWQDAACAGCGFAWREVSGAAMRLRSYAVQGQASLIIHLGDHDPSGMDMSRDIEDRIRLFMGRHARLFEFTRIALNPDQVEEYSPPPNPVKLTDSRSGPYQDKHGDESWELDALEPTVLAALIRENVERARDDRKWSVAVEAEKSDRARLATAATHWPDVAEWIEGEFDIETVDESDE